MHFALYRSERPETFEEMIGQKHIVKILQNQLRTGTVNQAYLFTGIRGTGKTTTARILAKALNCTGDGEQLPCGKCENCKAIRDGKYMDVIEIDAASNNKVDDIRSLIDSVYYPPVLGKYKIYIIDEVHMLTDSAENAFLKTLEEPPEYVVFILATTDPEKVKPTIRSRCMTLNFKRVSENELTEGMAAICSRKNVNITEQALRMIARSSDGSVRDALSTLEQCISAGDDPVTEELVTEYTGNAGRDFYLGLTENVFRQNMNGAMEVIDQAIRSGADPKILLSEWVNHMRDLMVVKMSEKPEVLVKVSPENMERLREQASMVDIGTITGDINHLTQMGNLGKYSSQGRVLLETAAVQLMTGNTGILNTSVPAVPAAPAVSARGVAPAAPVEPVSAGRAEAARGRVSSAQAPVSSKKRPEAGKGKPKAAPRTAMTSRAMAAAQGNSGESQKSSGTSRQIKGTPPSTSPSVDGIQNTASSADLKQMWNFIVKEMESRSPSNHVIFMNLELTAVLDGEVMISALKKRTLALAGNMKDEINQLVKSRYGNSYFVTIREKKANESVAKASKKQQNSARDGNSSDQNSAKSIEALAALAQLKKAQSGGRASEEPVFQPDDEETEYFYEGPEGPYDEEDYITPPADYVPPEVENFSMENQDEIEDFMDEEESSADEDVESQVKNVLGQGIKFTID
ncbi:DNA polymerase III subunit gamma/tau [Clostridiales Family XIII bacterium RF-744-FAT-WT-3]|uniref:DNA-directed DNA polymerase n=1 Tax=Baileyella intestinalis TaxID=2606709 RepID=A0A6A8MAJ6_9FIRM|nr:DNA polymerase III subunit gamma/tau [Baileyella intestinalis]MST69468.1 DNA polymerase III subunit gamma/tau [Baileyella intestinalis]